MLELNVHEENRLLRLLQLDDASFEKLLSLAEKRHNPDNLINLDDLRYRIQKEMDQQRLGQQVKWEVVPSMMAFPKAILGEVKEVTVPVVHLFIGLRSPLIGKSELDNHNWYVLTVEPNPTEADLRRGIALGLDDLRKLNTAQMNGGVIDSGPQALQ
jgi:hypothetical protein